MARDDLAPGARDDWWDKATPEMVKRVHEAATAWKVYDPGAAQTMEKSCGPVQDRYGIDVNDTGDAISVSGALARTAQARAESDSKRFKGRSRGHR